MRLIEHAIYFANLMHTNQSDLRGEPYIFHPLRVMLAVKEDGGDEEEQAAAVLHDVVEDAGVKIEQIYELFGPIVGFLVEAMTQVEGETYQQYIERVKRNGARTIRIKKADLSDNWRMDRIIKKYTLYTRYARAIDFLDEE